MKRRVDNRRWLCLFLLIALSVRLAAPAVLLAQERERLDHRLLRRMASGIETIVEKVCERFSRGEGNEPRLKTFLCDDRFRVFCDIEGTKTMGTLALEKGAADGYEVLDRRGFKSIKAILSKGFTAQSILYHLGTFILKGAKTSAETAAKLTFGGAIGASLAGSIGTVVGPAIAAAAIGIIGDIVIEKLTRDLPMWLHFRKLRKLHERLESTETGSTEEAQLLDDVGTVEDRLADWVDNEIATDRYDFFHKLQDKLVKAKEKGNLSPYEGLIEKITDKLTVAAVHDENFNASRMYYQLLEALGRLPHG